MKSEEIIKKTNSILKNLEKELMAYNKQLITPISEIGVYQVADADFNVQENWESDCAFTLDPPTIISFKTLKKPDRIMRLGFSYVEMIKFLNNKPAFLSYINQALSKMFSNIGVGPSNAVGSVYATLKIPGLKDGFIIEIEPTNGKTLPSYEIRIYSNATKMEI